MNNNNNNIMVTIIATIIIMAIGYGIALFVVSMVTHTEYMRLLTSPYTIMTFVFLIALELYSIIKRSKDNDDKK